MSIFDIFSSKKTETEIRLENYYAERLRPVGIKRSQIIKAIKSCRENAKKEGTLNMTNRFGDYLIYKSKESTGEIETTLEKAILGGASENDFREWWNLNDIERRMIVWEDEIFRIAAFESFVKQGMSKEEAFQKLVKSFPIYGDPTDESNFQGKDRPLPYELHLKIDISISRIDPFYVKQNLPFYSSIMLS